MVSLKTLHMELLQHIASFLPFEDVANLRLTCRVIGTRVAQAPNYKTTFRRKTIVLRPDDLRKIVETTRNDNLVVSLLHECRLVAVVPRERPTSTAFEGIPSCAPLLAQVFRNLKQHSPPEGLDMIVTVRDDWMDEANGNHAIPPRRLVWDVALQALDVTMAALRVSQLSLNKVLDIFFSDPFRCSLASTAFVFFLNEQAKNPSEHAFKSLSELRLRLSAPHRASAVRGQPLVDTIEGSAEVQRQYSTQALWSLMNLAFELPDLKHICLHWYQLGEGTFLSPAAESLQAPSEHKTADIPVKSATTSLASCALCGIFVSEADLLQFLKAVRPEHLVLRDVHLIPGTYASIFEYLADPSSAVTSYELDDLREGGHRRLVHFDIEGKPKFPYKGISMGPSTLIRKNEETKKPIPYRLPTRRALGSGEVRRWEDSKTALYGPPPLDAYVDDVQWNV